MNIKRFEVALSFAGEDRAYVSAVAANISTAIGKEKILYDGYMEAELARMDLDVYLQDLYHNHSSLIVVFISSSYEKKEWCGLEMRAIRDLIKRRHASSVMLIRFDSSELPGVFSIDGYINASSRPPEEIASLILSRCAQQAKLPSVSPILPETLPNAPTVEIFRETFIKGIASELKDHEVIAVNGPIGIGKTTLLAQFYRKFSESSIAVFLRGTSSATYDLQLVKDEISQQAQALLERHAQGRFVIKAEPIDTKQILAQLRKAALSKEKIFTFIIDGLDDIPEDQSAVAHAIFQSLPLGFKCFKFVISGRRALRFLQDNKRSDYGQFTVTGFTEHEVCEYLRDLFPRDEDVSRLKNLGEGYPGYFAALRRIRSSQANMPADLPSTLEKVLDLEWGQLNEDPLAEPLIAFICFDKRQHTIESLAGLLKVSTEQIETTLSRITVVRLTSGIVSFASDLFRPLAEKRLQNLKKATFGRLIEYFLTDSKSEESITHLPDVLSRAQRYEELVSYLDDAFLLQALTRKNAPHFLQTRSSLALNAAAHLERGEDALRFGLHRSNLNYLYLDEHWTGRIDAFLTIGEIEAALRTARASLSAEDRVQALSAIVRHQKEKGLSPAEDVLNELREDVRQLSRDQLGMRAYDIAADLVHALPSLAFELFEYASANNKPTAQTDIAVARFSLDAQIAKAGDHLAPDALEGLSRRITDPELRTFTYAARNASRAQSPQEILADVQKMSSDKEKLYYLRVWCSENHKHPSRSAIARFAVDAAIASKEVPLTAAFFIDILSSIRGTEDCREIIKIIDGQIPLLPNTSPTIECKRLQILLAETESPFDISSADGRISKLIESLPGISDPSTRAAVIAELIAMTHRVRKQDERNVLQNRLPYLSSELECCVSIVLDKTADHYQVLKECLKALAAADFSTACSFAERINTEYRRNEAYSDIIATAIARRTRACDIELLTPWFEKITNERIRCNTTHRVLRVLAYGPNRDATAFKTKALERWVKGIESREEKVVALALLHVVRLRFDAIEYESDGRYLLRDIDAIVKALPPSAVRIVAMYSLTHVFSEKERSLARSYLAQAERLRSQMVIRSASSEHCLYLNLKLTLRAFGALMPKQAYSNADTLEVISIVLQLPSLEQKVELIAELAVRFYLAEKLDECRRVVREHLQPLLGSAEPASAVAKNVLVVAAPALYSASQLSCLAQIASLDGDRQEEALSNILHFLFTRLVPGEPHLPDNSFAENLDADRMYEILQLTEKLENDTTICYFLHQIILFSESETGRRLNRNEREELARRIAVIVESKLPNCRFIKHEGYRILGEAYVAALRAAKMPAWEALLERSRKLPNLSDRAFVATCLAELLASRYQHDCRRIAGEAIALVARIPVAYDRLDRLVTIAQIIRPIDAALFKQALSAVIGKEALLLKDTRIDELRTRAVDLAYEFDPKYADTLLKDLDDKSQQNSVKQLRKQLERLKLEDRMREEKNYHLSEHEDEDLDQANWRLLQRLNSGVISACTLKQMIPSLKRLDRETIRNGFWVLSFAVESSAVIYSRTDEAFTTSKRIYESCLNSTKLVLDYIRTLKNDIFIDIGERGSNYQMRKSNFKPGDKARLIEAISLWAAENMDGRITFADSGFRKEDLEMVAVLRASAPASTISVLMSRKHCEQVYDGLDVRKAFREAWKELKPSSASSGIHICVIGSGVTGELPFDQRALVGMKSALILSCSWHGMVDQEIEIERIEELQRGELEERLDRLISSAEVSDGAEGLDYLRFSIT